MFSTIRHHTCNPALAISPTIANYATLSTMASFCSVLLAWFVLAVSPMAISAADPDPVQDYCVADTSSAIFLNGVPCLNPTATTPNHFTTSDLGTPGNTSASPFGFSFIQTTPQNLPGANTQGLTMLRIDVAVGGVVPLHVHPRSSEMVFIVQGEFNVGFVDTSNRLFSTNIKAGDVFMIPRGVVHYQLNIGSTPGLFLATLNGQNPGFVIVALATFATNPSLPTEVLSKSFKITPQEVEKIEEGLAGN